MMLVMLGLWKPFMKHVKLTFKANKPFQLTVKVLPPNLTAISLRFCHPTQFFTDSSSPAS